MSKPLFISLPVRDLQASITFYTALGFTPDPKLSGEGGACMVWSEAIQLMLVSHAKWRTFTQRYCEYIAPPSIPTRRPSRCWTRSCRSAPRCGQTPRKVFRRRTGHNSSIR